jgi:hypothetical protein
MTRSMCTTMLAKWSRAAMTAAVALVVGAGVAPTVATASAPAAPARSGPPTIMTGVFQIQNWGGAFRCLNASPSGGPVTAAKCDLDAVNQLWWRTSENEFIPWRGAVSPYYCLTASASNSIYLVDCSRTIGDAWNQVDETMRNSRTGQCLTVDAEDRLYTSACTGADDQRWRFFGS